MLNQITFGDCLEILPTIKDNSIDLLLTDPPYQFVTKKNITGGGFYNNENKKHLEKIERTFGLNFAPKEFLELVKPKMKKINFAIFCNKQLLKEYIQFAEDNNCKWDLIIYHKLNPVPAFNNHFLTDKEYCIYISEGGSYFAKGLRYEDYFSVISLPIGTKQTEHPTEKPTSLISKIMQVLSQEGGVVLDPFAGSGTTGIVANNLKRNFICIENNQEYFDIATNRLAMVRSQLKLF